MFRVVAAESWVTFTTTSIHRIVGRTSDMVGEIVFDPTRLGTAARGRVVVAGHTLSTGNRRRDARMHRAALESDRFPDIVIATDSVRTESTRLEEGQTARFAVEGTLQLHGVTGAVQFLVAVERREDKLVLTGATELRMTDYGITPPRLLFLRVRDRTEVRFQLVLRPAD